MVIDANLLEIREKKEENGWRKRKEKENEKEKEDKWRRGNHSRDVNLNNLNGYL